jgi:RHS repeat-associated protein
LTTTDYVFNATGQRVSEWNGTTHVQQKGKYYWGANPVAYYAGNATHFEHQDWLGTERARTTYNASVEGSFTSLPFGDGYTPSGADGDANHFAMLDHDTETNTDHAQFRQYSNSQGRWMRPDPDGGSYKIRNPQSFNRYVYTANRPLSITDPLGLDGPDDPCNDPLSGVVCYENDDGGGGGGGNGSGEGDGSGVGASGDNSGNNSSFPPGSIVQDQSGNLYMVNSDGSITPLVQGYVVVNGNDSNTCNMSDPACRQGYEQLMSQLSAEQTIIQRNSVNVTDADDAKILQLSIDVSSMVSHPFGPDLRSSLCNYSLFMADAAVGSSLPSLGTSAGYVSVAETQLQKAWFAVSSLLTIGGTGCN